MDWLNSVTHFLDALNPLLTSILALVGITSSGGIIAVIRWLRTRSKRRSTLNSKSVPERKPVQKQRPNGSSRAVRANPQRLQAASPTQAQHIENSPTFNSTFNPTIIVQQSPIMAPTESSDPRSQQLLQADTPAPSHPGTSDTPITAEKQSLDEKAGTNEPAQMSQLIAPTSVVDRPHVAPPEDALLSSQADSKVHQDKKDASPLPELEIQTELDPQHAADTGSVEDILNITQPNQQATSTIHLPPVDGEGQGQDNSEVEQNLLAFPSKIESASPSGKLIIPQHIRDQRRNLRFALRHASFIVQEARASMKKYRRLPEDGEFFQDEVRMHKALYEYLNNAYKEIELFNRAMNKLTISWDQNDPRQTIFGHPEVLKHLFDRTVPRSTTSVTYRRFRRGFHQSMAVLVKKAEHLGYTVRFVSYTDPAYPNRKWVYVLTKARNVRLEVAEPSDDDENDDDSSVDSEEAV